MSSFGNRVLPSSPSDRNSHTVSSDGKGGCDDVRWEFANGHGLDRNSFQSNECLRELATRQMLQKSCFFFVVRVCRTGKEDEDSPAVRRWR